MTNSNIVSKYRKAIVGVLDAFAECRDLELQITSQGGAGVVSTGDAFEGNNSDLDADKFAGLITSRAALEAVVSANGNGHYTNLMKARP